MVTRAEFLERLELELLAPTPDEIAPVRPLLDGADLLRLVEEASREIPAERWSRAYRSHRARAAPAREAAQAVSDWRERAACRGLPVEWWFQGTGHSYEKARAICAVCPVTSECLEYVEVAPVYGAGMHAVGAEWRLHGMWGAKVPAERGRRSRRRNRQ